MARTDFVTVQGVVEVRSDVSLTPAIDAAHALTDWLESQDCDGLLTTDLLRQIETYLAAHFYQHRCRDFQTESVGRASGTYQGATSFVLSSTQHGQDAMLLDVTGRLAQRSKQAERGTLARPRLRHIGF